jgi:hypothetical protein
MLLIISACEGFSGQSKFADIWGRMTIRGATGELNWSSGVATVAADRYNAAFWFGNSVFFIHGRFV